MLWWKETPHWRSKGQASSSGQWMRLFKGLSFSPKSNCSIGWQSYRTDTLLRWSVRFYSNNYTNEGKSKNKQILAKTMSTESVFDFALLCFGVITDNTQVLILVLYSGPGRSQVTTDNATEWIWLESMQSELHAFSLPPKYSSLNGKLEQKQGENWENQNAAKEREIEERGR